MVLFATAVALWKWLWQKLASTWTGSKSYLRVRTQQVPGSTRASPLCVGTACVQKKSWRVTNLLKSAWLEHRPGDQVTPASVPTDWVTLCKSCNLEWSWMEIIVSGPACWEASQERFEADAWRVVAACKVPYLTPAEGTAVKCEQFSATHSVDAE